MDTSTALTSAESTKSLESVLEAARKVAVGMVMEGVLAVLIGMPDSLSRHCGTDSYY